MKQSEQLAHSLRTRHVVMIALGGVIGGGFFIGSSAAIAMGGPAVLLSFALVGVLIWQVNMMMRDLAMKTPGRASFLRQIRYALGNRIGFLAGWTYWVTWVTVIAVEAIAVGLMLGPMLHVPPVVVELVVLAVMTGINLLSVKGYGEFEYWFAIIKVVAIIVFIAVSVWVVLRNPGNVSQNLLGHGGLVPNGFLSLLAVLPTVLFSMSGSEIATVAAVESDHAEENIARATKTVPLRIGVFYLASMALILCQVPWSDVVPGHSPFLLALTRLHIPFAGVAMGVVILTATLSCLNSGIYVTSRILFELAEDGNAPSALLTVDPKTQLPRRALLTSVGAAVLIGASAIVAPNIIFGVLVSLTGAFMMVTNVLLIFGRLKVMPEKAFGAYVALLVMVLALVAMLLQADTRYQLELGAAVIVLILLAERFLPRGKTVQNNVR